MAARTQEHSPEKAWLLRAFLVLQSPRAVFAAIRDDSDESAHVRAESVLAVVWLTGISAVLASPAMNNVMDDPARDAVVVAIILFIGGGLYGFVAYFILSAILHGCVRALGSQGTFRRTRHLFAFATAPVALALPTFWVVRIAIEGKDLFKYGGSDTGHVFADAFYVFVAWTVVLALIGVRTIHGWSWPRAGVAVAVATTAATLLVLWTSVL